MTKYLKKSNLGKEKFVLSHSWKVQLGTVPGVWSRCYFVSCEAHCILWGCCHIYPQSGFREVNSDAQLAFSFSFVHDASQWSDAAHIRGRPPSLDIFDSSLGDLSRVYLLGDSNPWLGWWPQWIFMVLSALFSLCWGVLKEVTCRCVWEGGATGGICESLGFKLLSWDSLQI